MTQIPLFTVVITTYNRPNLLTIAINSVINQSESSWELIIVNDGSSDDYNEIERIAKADRRIRYYYKKNEERSVARNFGIQKAKGTYICFLDDDDYYLEKHLTTLKTHINKNETSNFFFTGAYMKLKGILKKKPLIGKCHDKNELIEKIIYQHIWLCTVCIKRIVLLENQFVPQLNIWEDINLFLKIISKYKAIEISEYTSVVVEHDTRSTTESFEIYDSQKLKPYFDAVKDLFGNKEFSQYFTIHQKRKFLATKYLTYLKNSFWHKNYKSTIYFFYGLVKTSIATAFSFEILKMFFASVLFIFIPSLQRFHNGIQDR